MQAPAEAALTLVVGGGRGVVSSTNESLLGLAVL